MAAPDICRARATADPPQDCDAPFCGCDPAWSYAIELLRESGWLSPEEIRVQVRQRVDDPHLWVCERHPDRAPFHDGCAGPGMLLREYLTGLHGAIEEAARLITACTSLPKPEDRLLAIARTLHPHRRRPTP